jgi:uncharacterized protein Yka (UPF0111/DUF47 family)
MAILDKIANRLLQGGEEGILKECAKTVKIAMDANVALEGFIKTGKGIGRIRELEKKSDNESFAVANIITSGAVAPNILDNLLILVNKQDNIVDSIYNLSREMRRYRIRDKKTNALLQNKVLDINSYAEAAISTLLEMYNQSDLEKHRALRGVIEDLEEAGDEAKEDLLDFAYTAKIADFKTFYHILQTAYRADDILDSCEDSSNTLMSIFSSIVT